VLEHLCAEETRAQEKDHGRDDDVGRNAAAPDVVRMEAHAALVSSTGRSAMSASTPATAVTNADSDDHTRICISSSAPCIRRSTTFITTSYTHFPRKRKNPFNST